MPDTSIFLLTYNQTTKKQYPSNFQVKTINEYAELQQETCPEMIEYVCCGQTEDNEMKERKYDEHMPLLEAEQQIKEGKIFRGKFDIPRLFPDEGILYDQHMYM